MPSPPGLSEDTGRSVEVVPRQGGSRSCRRVLQTISPPVAITVFPGESYRAPETWARRAYRNLIYFREVDRGGHFAAWEQPELFSTELRAAYRSLRASQ